MRLVRVWSFYFSPEGLCAIPTAAFDVQFGTIQDNMHPLAKKYVQQVFVSVYLNFARDIP